MTEFYIKLLTRIMLVTGGEGKGYGQINYTTTHDDFIPLLMI